MAVIPVSRALKSGAERIALKIGKRIHFLINALPHALSALPIQVKPSEFGNAVN